MGIRGEEVHQVMFQQDVGRLLKWAPKVAHQGAGGKLSQRPLFDQLAQPIGIASKDLVTGRMRDDGPESRNAQLKQKLVGA